MRSNYKRIGELVKQVRNRNTDMAVSNLQGIRINKEYMPSVANTNGTDLSKYRVVRKDQFAYNPMHVGRDEVLPIGMLETDEPVIVSPAYVVFDIIDKKKLLPEYLMMWCRRPEFDRNAWFTTDSSVRGGFSWNDFCEMKLPVPAPEKQLEIVTEYHTIVDRIKLNERLSQKLEETSQTIYNKWFVDFEFPIFAEYASKIGNQTLVGQPYKSSGGEMIYSEELEKEIPKGWDVKRLSELINIKHGFAFKGEFFTNSENEYILLSPGNFKIGGGFKINDSRFYEGDIPDEYVFSPGDLMVTMTDLSKQTDTLGYPALIPKIKNKKLLHNQRLGKVEFISNFNFTHTLFSTMCSFNYRNSILGGATGTTVKHTSPTKITEFSLAMPNQADLFEKFEKISSVFHKRIEEILIENLNLVSMKNLLHSNMVRF